MRQSSCHKTVYVLGAGFSYDGGFPLQKSILQKIFEYDFDILSGDDSEEFLRYTDDFLTRRTLLREFIDRVFYKDSLPSLEDLFTLLDQTIAKRGHCLNYTWKNLDNIRDVLKRLILVIFHYASDKLTHDKDSFYKSLAKYFIEERKREGINSDPFSIVSLNWDSLLEDSIYSCLCDLDKRKKVDVDFCCYSSQLDSTCRHTPSVLQKAKKIYNIKILKLHGSSNWLLCPNCNRLYTGLGATNDVWNLYVETQVCRYCRYKNKEEKQGAPGLEPFFITPTFAKVFDNTHIQMVWHNAYTELAEADKVVFIGYSLPEADYHLRTLIRRAIKPDVPIEVVLTGDDIPKKNTPMYVRKFFASARYADFFGNHRVTFHVKGVKEYFRKKVKVKRIKKKGADTK